MTSKIRKPNNEDLNECVRLLFISGPHLYSYLFVVNEPQIYRFINLLLDMPGFYSKENVYVEEEDGKIRGLLLAYPASNMKRFAKNMLRYIKDIFMILGLFNFVTFIYRFRLNAYFPKTENDELFISNLAVFEEYRGKGIAKKLLENAEAIALEKGLNKLSLFVEIDNYQAKRVYNELGFLETKKVVLPKRYNKHGLFGFYKMIKIIEKKE